MADHVVPNPFVSDSVTHKQEVKAAEDVDERQHECGVAECVVDSVPVDANRMQLVGLHHGGHDLHVAIPKHDFRVQNLVSEMHQSSRTESMWLCLL